MITDMEYAKAKVVGLKLAAIFEESERALSSKLADSKHLSGKYTKIEQKQSNAFGCAESTRLPWKKTGGKDGT